jgi:hypothetical protein
MLVKTALSALIFGFRVIYWTVPTQRLAVVTKLIEFGALAIEELTQPLGATT